MLINIETDLNLIYSMDAKLDNFTPISWSLSSEYGSTGWEISSNKIYKSEARIVWCQEPPVPSPSSMESRMWSESNLVCITGQLNSLSGGMPPHQHCSHYLHHLHNHLKARLHLSFFLVSFENNFALMRWKVGRMFQHWQRGCHIYQRNILIFM